MSYEIKYNSLALVRNDDIHNIVDKFYQILMVIH